MTISFILDQPNATDDGEPSATMNPGRPIANKNSTRHEEAAPHVAADIIAFDT